MASWQLNEMQQEEVIWVPGVAADMAYGRLEPAAEGLCPYDSATWRSSCVPSLERCGSPVHSGKRPCSRASIGSPGSAGPVGCSRVPWVPAGISSGAHHHPARTYPTSPRNSLNAGGRSGSPVSSRRPGVQWDGTAPAGCTCGAASQLGEGPEAAMGGTCLVHCSWAGLEGDLLVPPAAAAPRHLRTPQRAAAEELLAAVQQATLADGTELLQQQLRLLRQLQDLLSTSIKKGVSSSSSSSGGALLPVGPRSIGLPAANPSSTAATVLRVKRLQCRVVSLQHQVLLLLGSRPRGKWGQLPAAAPTCGGLQSAAPPVPPSLVAATWQATNGLGGRSRAPPAASDKAGQQQKQQQQQQQQQTQLANTMGSQPQLVHAWHPRTASTSASTESSSGLLVAGPPGTIFKRRVSTGEDDTAEMSLRPGACARSSHEPEPEEVWLQQHRELPDTSPSFRLCRSSSSDAGVESGLPPGTHPVGRQDGSCRRSSSGSSSSSRSSRSGAGGTSSRGALVLAAALAADNRVLAAEVAALQQLLVAERVAGWRNAEAVAAALARRLAALVPAADGADPPVDELPLLSPVAREERDLLDQLAALEQELEEVGAQEGQQEGVQHGSSPGSPPGSPPLSHRPNTVSTTASSRLHPQAAAAAAEQLVQVADQIRCHYSQQDWGSQVASLLAQVQGRGTLAAGSRNVPAGGGRVPPLSRQLPPDVEKLSACLAQQLAAAGAAQGDPQLWGTNDETPEDRLLMNGGSSLAAYVTTPSGHVTPCVSRRATGTLPPAGGSSCPGSWSGAPAPSSAAGSHSRRASTRLSRSQNSSMHRTVEDDCSAETAWSTGLSASAAAQAAREQRWVAWAGRRSQEYAEEQAAARPPHT